MARSVFLDVDSLVKSQLKESKPKDSKPKDSTPKVNISLVESVIEHIPEQDSLKTLNDVIPAYYEYNNLKNCVDKHLKEWNSRIKTSMGDLMTNSYTYDQYTATVSNTEKYNFIEDLLILKLRELEKTEGLDASRFIKTKEYVDLEELERAIYSKELVASDFSDCQTVSVTQTLRVKKNKEKKDDSGKKTAGE